MKGKLYGNGLWESSRMMLPEHKEAILQYNTNLKRRPRVILDEQEMEEISRTINESLRSGREIRLKLYGEFEDRELCGVVDHKQQGDGRIRLHTDQGTVSVCLKDILAVD